MMRVEVRGLLIVEGLLVVAREQRQGLPRLSIPGGRVERDETLEETLVREVLEEVGIPVAVGRLVYLAQVVRPQRAHDLNVVFLAIPTEPLDRSGLVLVDPAAPDEAVYPPMLGAIARDLRDGWSAGPRWLGNIWHEDPTATSPA